MPIKKLIQSLPIIMVAWVFFLPCQGLGRVYELGPGKAFSELSDVPFDNLKPGDQVRIFFRALPYRGIFILRRSGTKNRPIIISGVPGSDGKLPVIDGEDAVQSQKDLSNQDGRWLIRIGDKTPGDFVVIKKLHLRNANNAKKYFERNKSYPFKDNAGGVFVKLGRHVTISECEIHACGNGVITGYWPDVGFLTIEKSYIHRNGNFKNPLSSQEHNLYLGGAKSVVQFNRLSSPRSGHTLKERGKDTVIRYNWIDHGNNRQLDLVDYSLYRNANAYVYGNVIIQGKNPRNRNMIHWGGDSKVGSRAGTLFFVNNTVIGQSGRTYYLVTRKRDCSIVLKNNVFTGSGILWNYLGRLNGSYNWFSDTIETPPRKFLGKKGRLPGFLYFQNIPYFPLPGGGLQNRGTNFVPFKVNFMPNPRALIVKRPVDGLIDIGAFEYSR